MILAKYFLISTRKEIIAPMKRIEVADKGKRSISEAKELE